MSFTLQLTASAAMNQFTITYYTRTSAANGSDTSTWAYSINGGAFVNFTTQPSTVAPVSTTTWAASSAFTVSENVSVLVGQTITFRNTLTGATANNVNVNFDTIQVSAVPEPANVALAVFGLGAVSLGVGRRLYARKKA